MFIDDIRHPPTNGDWILVRSVTEAIDYIKQNGWPSEVSFDHDLGFEEIETPEGTLIYGDELPNGYDFAKWLVLQDNECPWMAQNNFTWRIHSANPVGATNIDMHLKWYTTEIMDKN